MFKKSLYLLCFLSGVALAAPITPINGGDGIPNDNANTETRNAPMVFNGSASSAFSIDTLTKGARPYPVKTTAQRDAIVSPENGLEIYNSDTKTVDYYDNFTWQTGLSIQHLLAGANVSITNNGNGTATVSSSGSSTPDAAYASFSTQNNSTATTFPALNTFKPVYLGGSLSTGTATDFTNQFLTIDSVNTPVMTYTGATTQEFDVHESFSIRGAVATMATFKFCIAIRLANGTVNVTNYCQLATASNLVDFIPGPKLVANVELNTGDSVFAEVQNITNTNSIYAAFSNYLSSSVAGSASLTLQNAYDNDPTYPYAYIQLPSSDPFAEIGVIAGDGSYSFAAGQVGIYTEKDFGANVQDGTLGGYFRVGHDAENRWTLLSVECYSEGHCWTLPFPAGGFNAISTTGLPTGAGMYNRTTKTLQLFDGSQMQDFLSSNQFSGDITVSSSGAATLASSGIAKVVAITQALASQTMIDSALSNRYFVSNVSLLTLTLPTSPSVGHIYEIVGAGNAPWRINQNTGQAIVTSVNGIIVSTTPGTSGHVDGANSSDCIDLMYVGGGVFIVKSEQTSGVGIVLN